MSLKKILKNSMKVIKVIALAFEYEELSLFYTFANVLWLILLVYMQILT